MSEIKLTNRQLSSIPHIVNSSTYTEGCAKAKINKTTLYKWLKEPQFRCELNRQRDEITAEAFAVLSQALTKAVETLTGLLDTQDNRLKRLVCNDIIEHIIKHKEIEAINERLVAIEQRLAEKAN